MESSEETGFQAQERPVLCINNCGFFGTATTMNMCSKCHNDMISKQQQPKLASKDHTVIGEALNAEITFNFGSSHSQNSEGSKRCNSCNKRLGLLGFNCRCGNMFCSVHRYSDEHNCPYDYRASARESIAKENPLVKANKLEKI